MACPQDAVAGLLSSVQVLRCQLQQHARRCTSDVVLACKLVSLGGDALLLPAILGIASGEPAKLVMRRVIADCRSVHFKACFVTPTRYPDTRLTTNTCIIK